jgi:hypothetical protein
MKARTRAAMMVLAATTTVILALTACGGGSAQEEKAKARALPEDPKALRPGVYRSEEFRPSFSFRVGKGWSSTPLEASDVLQITTREQTAGLTFLNIQEVYKPTKTGTPNVVDAPRDIVAWEQQHPYLQTSEPEPVTVGGVKGVQFDVVLGDLPKDYSGTCRSIVGHRNCVDLFRLSTGRQLFQAEGEKVRVTVLEDVEGETVTIGFGTLASDFDEFASKAQKVVDSVKWRGS